MMAINLKDSLYWSSTAVRPDNVCGTSTATNINLTNLMTTTNTSAYQNTLSICNDICSNHTKAIELAQWLHDAYVEMPKENESAFPKDSILSKEFQIAEEKETEKMPIKFRFDVKSVDVYNDKVVKVTFDDGSFTKSVCSDNDHFDVDVGITICLLKKLLGKNPNREYDKLIRDIHKVMDKNEKEKQKAKEEKELQRKLHRKAELKKAANHLKWKREMIDIQKQAIIEAENYLAKEE